MFPVYVYLFKAQWLLYIAHLLTFKNLAHVRRVYLRNLFQMKPASCTLLLSIFISTSLHVSDNYVSISRRTYCNYTTLVFFILYG